jgi:actin-like ATPase involved in cell morphogenesis
LAKGLDIGTMNIICAEKHKEDIVFMKQRNAFMNLDSSDLTKNMLDTSDVLYIENGEGISLLGEDAFKFATIFEKEARRPMSQGIISPKEKEAIPIMQLIVERVLGKPGKQKEVLYVSTPANPIDIDLDVLYHKKTMEALTKGLNYDTHVIDEGLAVVYSELGDYNFTGIGISVGAGLTNITLAYMASPLLSFSVGRGGDWIDEQVAKSTGLPKEHVTTTKEKISKLNKQVKIGSPEGALTIYYEALMTYIIENFNKRLAKITTPKVAFPVAIAGGSALPEGFFEIFEKKFREANLRVDIDKIIRAKDPLNSIARGCLIAAKTQEDKKRKEVIKENTTQTKKHK